MDVYFEYVHGINLLDPRESLLNVRLINNLIRRTKNKSRTAHLLTTCTQVYVPITYLLV